MNYKNPALRVLLFVLGAILCITHLSWAQKIASDELLQGCAFRNGG